MSKCTIEVSGPDAQAIAISLMTNFKETGLKVEQITFKQTGYATKASTSPRQVKFGLSTGMGPTPRRKIKRRRRTLPNKPTA